MMNDIFMSLAIFLLLLISSFSMYLPLIAISKDKAIALRYVIPFSISIEIITGYIFYCTSAMMYFPLSFLIIVIITNIWVINILKLISFRKINVNWSVLITSFIGHEL